jgi:competence protein ComEA
MKPGYKTSEFWFTLVSFVFSGLFLTGIITEHDDKEEFISVITHAVESIILIAGQAGIFYKYINGRKEYKKEYERNKNKELEDYVGVDNETDKININYAPLGEIILLPHIGPTTGQNIIDYRNNIKHFDDIEELKKVQGIGETTLREITPYITL